MTLWQMKDVSEQDIGKKLTISCLLDGNLSSFRVESHLHQHAQVGGARHDGSLETSLQQVLQMKQ